MGKIRNGGALVALVGLVVAGLGVGSVDAVLVEEAGLVKHELSTKIVEDGVVTWAVRAVTYELPGGDHVGGEVCLRSPQSDERCTTDDEGASLTVTGVTAQVSGYLWYGRHYSDYGRVGLDVTLDEVPDADGDLSTRTGTVTGEADTYGVVSDGTWERATLVSSRVLVGDLSPAGASTATVSSASPAVTWGGDGVESIHGYACTSGISTCDRYLLTIDDARPRVSLSLTTRYDGDPRCSLSGCFWSTSPVYVYPEGAESYGEAIIPVRSPRDNGLDYEPQPTVYELAPGTYVIAVAEDLHYDRSGYYSLTAALGATTLPL